MQIENYKISPHSLKGAMVLSNLSKARNKIARTTDGLCSTTHHKFIFPYRVGYEFIQLLP